MSNENKAIVRRFAEEVVAGGALDKIPELFAPGFVAHDPANPERLGGVEGARAFVAMLHGGLSDLRYVIEDLIGEGDRVVYRWSLRGTHTGPFMGVPPTGKSLELAGIDIFRLLDGKIIESWVVADASGLLRQLGAGAPAAAAPPPGPPSASPTSAPHVSAPVSGTPVSAVPPTMRS